MNSVCKKIRENLLKIAYKSGHGHIPTCFSIIELLYSIYTVMKHKPNNPLWDDRDIFILSKGHGSLALYVTLAQQGYFDFEDVNSYGAFGTKFGCHIDRTKVPGVEVSTGSLGHGISVGVGIALAMKLKEENRKVYIIVGDGESNEGSVWEAVMVANDLKLDNLTIVFDYNQSQRRSLQLNSPKEKFDAFGCDIVEVKGHDVKDLRVALKGLNNNLKVIIAHTTKGYGCKTLVEDVYAWHRRSPNMEEYKMLMEELNA